MAENKPFVINDRRKFTAEGELRPDVPHEPQPDKPREAAASQSDPAASGPQLVTEAPDQSPETAASGEAPAYTDDQLPPPPTAEQSDQANRAYSATVDRLDTAIRATNPGMERMPDMTFERFVQSLYMQAMLQLGGATEPGQQPQVDLLGARQTIDMLVILADKTKGNLSDPEDKLVQSALFELRMGFLEITQALARSAAAKQGVPGAPGFAGAPGAGGPSIVR